MPSLSQLSYLVAVQRAGHFGRATADCHVAQPTLSAQIQKAETELGVVIFDRSQKPIAATPQGRELLVHAQAVLAAHERLLEAAQSQHDELRGALALGVIPTLAPYVIPWFLPRFVQRHPKVSLTLHEMPTDEIVEEVLRHRLDAAVLATPLHVEAISERPLFFDPFYLYAHADEPLLRQQEVDPSELEAEALWLLQDGHCVRAQVINFCNLPGSDTHLGSVTFSAGSFETLRNLIDNSRGYTLFPETYVRTLPRAVKRGQVRPFDPQTPTREVSLVHHRANWRTGIIDALEEAIAGAIPRSLRQVSADGDVLAIRVE